MTLSAAAPGQMQEMTFNAALAEAMGCYGIRVERPADIQDALAQAFAANRPAVVDVATDPLDSLAPANAKPR